MGDFTMPSLGADMEKGTIVQWLVKPGDEVHRGDVVAVIDTEKSTIEVEIFETGVIDELLVPEGEEVPVGTALARVRAPAPAAAGERVTPPPAPVEEVPAPVLPPPHPGLVASPIVRHLASERGVDLTALEGSGPGGSITREDVERAAARPTPVGRVHASPLARRLAVELGVDLAAVRGTGADRAVVAEDVRRAALSAAPQAPAAARPEARPPRRGAEERQAELRRSIGALMARSKREIPHYYLGTTFDLAVASSWLDQVNQERPVTRRLVLPALLLKATAKAVAKVPEMNGFYKDDAFRPSAPVHVGVAVSLRTGGVIAPAIHDTPERSLDELMEGLRDLVTRARSGALRGSEMSDPTITVSNLGDLGAESVFGVIYPPQVALVGFGRVVDRPVAVEGMLAVHPCVTATLSADHRASDGHRGGLFLAEIGRLLQAPEEL